MKKVSILIVAFNPGEYLQATLKSVLNQTYQNIEILLLDNASKEDITVHIPEWEKIQYFRSNTNLGPYGGLNFLLEKASGEYVAIQDHDDIWHPEKIQKQIDFLESHQEFVGCGTNTLMYYEEDKKCFEYLLSERSYYTIHPSLVFRNNRIARYDISEGNYFTDAFFQKNILCNGGNLIANIGELLTLHIIKSSSSNYSYKWYTLSIQNIRRAYGIHPFSYATLTIGWEILRKSLYPILNYIGLEKYISTIERIPFVVLGKKVIPINNIESPMKQYLKNPQ